MSKTKEFCASDAPEKNFSVFRMTVIHPYLTPSGGLKLLWRSHSVKNNPTYFTPSGGLKLKFLHVCITHSYLTPSGGLKLHFRTAVRAIILPYPLWGIETRV